MGLWSGHRSRGGEEIARAEVYYFADRSDEVVGCAFDWSGAPEIKLLLPLLMADEWIHYMRKYPDGHGGYLLLGGATQASLEELSDRLDHARQQWRREGTLPQLQAPPIVEASPDGSPAGSKAEIAVVLERRNRRLFTDSHYDPKQNRGWLYTATHRVVWNRAAAQVSTDPGGTELLLDLLEALLRRYEETGASFTKTREIGRVPYELWGTVSERAWQNGEGTR